MSQIVAKFMPVLVFAVFLSFWIVPTRGSFKPNSLTECNRTDHTGCLSGQCCVYQVLIHKSMKTEKRINKRTICKSVKLTGDFCIPGDELFSCPCKNGLSCLKDGDQQKFGHCG